MASARRTERYWPTIDLMSAILTAISGLWPFILSLAVLILVISAIVFRKSIGRVLDRTKSATFEKGDIKANIELNNISVKTEERPGKEDDKDVTKTEIASKVEDKDISTVEIIQSDDKKEENSVSKFFLWLTAMHGREYEEADRLYPEVEAEQEFKKPNHIKRLPILRLRIKYENGDIQSLNQMLEMSKTDNSFFLLYSLGLSYLYADDHRRGIEYLNLAIKNSDDDDDTANAVSLIGKNMKESDMRGKILYLTNFIDKVNKDSAKYTIYRQIAEIYDNTGNDLMRAMILQKCAQLSVNDSSVYFDAAYAFALSNIDSMARENYLSTITFSTKNPMAVNNLAVSEHNLGMSFSSVKRYKSSIKEGETLAAANLIYRLIDAGFQDEAEEIIQEAKNQKDVHQNVSRAEVKLKESIEEEKKIANSIKLTADLVRTFSWDFVDNINVLMPNSVNGEWLMGSLNISVAVIGDLITITNLESSYSNILRGEIIGSSFIIKYVNALYSGVMSSLGFVGDAKICGYFTGDHMYIFISQGKADQKVLLATKFGGIPL